MRLEPECVGCLFNQILKTIKHLDLKIPRSDMIFLQKKMMAYLLEKDFDNTTAPLVASYLYDLIAKILKDPDPFHELKKKFNVLAMKYYDEIEILIKKAEDPVFEALIVAALGNTIDFAGQHKIDLINDLKNFSPRNLVINDYESFKTTLDNSKGLLILGDNAGEIVFDKLLITILRKKYPNLEIIYTVRASPIINDATIEDAVEINLTSMVKVITSSPIPGIDLSNVSEEFKTYFYSENHAILSKGQGNFECLYNSSKNSKPIYYLFKVKCNLMERIFQSHGAKMGDLIFIKI
ncbi:MAG: damage-control phosphatase ARMT1 family protein [Promethearchaeota archaeon]